jgi:hypothetical protein
MRDMLDVHHGWIETGLMGRALFTAVLSFIILVLPSADAYGCSCRGGIPICETFWKTPIVFSGEVLEVTRIEQKGRPSFLQRRRVRFRVEQTWRGEATPVIEVMTGSGGGDCGYNFSRGRRYLVFASLHEGVAVTGICSRTQPLDKAGKDLEYLKTAMAPRAAGRVFGEVTNDSGVTRGRPMPAPDRFVTLIGAGLELRARTDAKGYFEFSDVPAGGYTIAVEVHSREKAYGPVTVDLPDARGCAFAEFTIEKNRDKPSALARARPHHLFDRTSPEELPLCLVVARCLLKDCVARLYQPAGTMKISQVSGGAVTTMAAPHTRSPR